MGNGKMFKENDFLKIKEIIEEKVKNFHLKNREISIVDISTKNNNPYDLVSSRDKELELITRDALKRYDIPILGEEFGGEVGETFFTVDPIDGTLNYLSGSPLYGYNLAYIEEGEVVFGLTILPELNEVYYATKESGLKLNDKLLVREMNLSKRAVISTSQNKTKGSLSRVLGAASIELAWTAKGVYEGCYYNQLAIWDIAPGLIFNQLAGNVLKFKKNGIKKYEDIYIGGEEFTKNKSY